MFQNHLIKTLIFLMVGITLFFPKHAIASVQITLEWHPSPGLDIAGYRLFTRLEGQHYDYTNPDWEGSETECLVEIPHEELRYFFVVRAYNTAGSMSPNSAEVCYGCTVCPDDPEKTYAGVCGCGTPDKDIDVDGIWDCFDDDDDNDGIDDVIEANGPNQGDANSDDVPDSLQAHVVSTKPNGQTGYIVIESTEGNHINGFSQVENPSPGDVPLNIDFTCGLYEFEISNLVADEMLRVTVTLPNELTPLAYYSYGITHDHSTDHWYEVGNEGESGIEINGSILTLYLGDGLNGDNILDTDAKIMMLGGPAFSASDSDRHNDSDPETFDYPDSPETDGGCYLNSLHKPPAQPVRIEKVPPIR